MWFGFSLAMMVLGESASFPGGIYSVAACRSRWIRPINNAMMNCVLLSGGEGSWRRRMDDIIGHFSERKGGSGNGQSTGEPTLGQYLAGRVQITSERKARSWLTLQLPIFITSACIYSWYLARLVHKTEVKISGAHCSRNLILHKGTTVRGPPLMMST